MIFLLFFNSIIGDHLHAKFEIDSRDAGFFMALGALTYAFTSPFIDKVFHNVPRRYIFFIGFILATVALFYLGNSPLLGYPDSIALTIVGGLLLGVAVSCIFVPLMAEIIDTVQRKEGLGEDPRINDKASAVFNASYATGCCLGPIIGAELFEANSVFDKETAECIKSGFPETCDIMAFCAFIFCILYFLVNILPHLIWDSKKKP